VITKIKKALNSLKTVLEKKRLEKVVKRCLNGDVRHYPFATGWFLVKNKGILSFGKNVLLRSFKWNPIEISINHGAELYIGDNVFINQGVRLVSGTSIIIENNVHIGDESLFLGEDFHSVDKNNNPKKGLILIKEGAWIASRVIILKNCVIGKNSVVAAGSVVTKDIPDNVMVAGVPAKILKKINQ